MQGFPDSYVFGDASDHSPSTATEVATWLSSLSATQSDTPASIQQFRQIGNAVPVPLAAALGRAVGKAVFQMWKDRNEERMRADSPEL